MKIMIAALLALPLSALHAQNSVTNFDDIQFWVGSGPKRAALVLQWNDGLNPGSVAWGYRWDGTATGMDMLRAVAGSTRIEDPSGDPVGTESGADARLQAGLVQYGFGLSVLSFDYALLPGSVRTNSDWFSGYWEYLIRGGSFDYYDWTAGQIAEYSVAGSPDYASGSWTSSPIGADDRHLIDGAWDAYSFAPVFISQALVQPVAVPLPLPAVACEMGEEFPIVSVATGLGFTYQLEYCNSAYGPWVKLGESEPGTGGEVLFVDESTDPPPQRFYRISVTQIP